MARKPRKPKEDKSVASELLKAFEFISLVQRNEGLLHETHCYMSNGVLCAFNGVLAAGISIKEDLNACPHTLRMRDALRNCGQELSITQTANDCLSIRSERFRASVPCIDQTQLMPVSPDAPCAVINDTLKEGFDKIAHLAKDNAERVIEASVLLKRNTMVSTNGKVMLEFWHGIDLPPQLAIPKVAVTVIGKVKSSLSKLGFSDNTVTFYYEDNSWIRTQRYVEQWPDTDRVLNMVSYPKEIHPGLFRAIDSVASFSENDRIFLKGNKVQSHDADNVGASYAIDEFDATAILDYRHLKSVETHMREVDFTVRNNAIYFRNNMTRGAIAVMTCT